MATMPKKYTDEFKKTAVELVESGLPQKQVCADLGISKSALQAWVRDAQLEQRGIKPAVDAEERREQAAMLKRIKELETENLMADSTGGRNEFRELLRWCQIAERFAWSTVERVLDRGQLSAGDDAQIGALRQVLA